MPIMGLGVWGERRERGRGESLNRRFNAISRASQVHSSGNYGDTVPINQAYYKSGIISSE
jgi:hypothetical protein